MDLCGMYATRIASVAPQRGGGEEAHHSSLRRMRPIATRAAKQAAFDHPPVKERRDLWCTHHCWTFCLVLWRECVSARSTVPAGDSIKSNRRMRLLAGEVVARVLRCGIPRQADEIDRAASTS
jgi:hypothetical protein